jgi:hypothetical protein
MSCFGADSALQFIEMQRGIEVKPQYSLNNNNYSKGGIMALMDWLKKRLAGDMSAELTFSPEESSLSGLNLAQVLDAHMAWKSRLQNTLHGTSTEQLEVSVVAQDNMCVLGKWLYGEGKKQFGHLLEYEALRKTHADFHLCAGEVLIEHHNGKRDAAENILKGKFRNQSDMIQLDLVRLFAAAKRIHQ